jgi:hypothetical protein
MRVMEWTDVRGRWIEGRRGEDSVRLAAVRRSMYVLTWGCKGINTCDKKLRENLKFGKTLII